MKFAIPVILLMALLCVFMPQQPTKDSGPPASKSDDKKADSSKHESLIAAHAAQQAEKQRQRRTELDNLMARNAQAMTPKLKEMMINRLMEVRSPQYKKLFDTWQLDPATQANLLDVVREREERVFDLMREQRAEGMSGIKKFGLEHSVEKTLAEVQFSQLVGDERAAEIKELEASFLFSAQQRSAKAVNLHTPD